MGKANNIVFIVHYFPPMNSTGAKRVEALAKYFVRAGRSVTVITTCKTSADGPFTEKLPEGANVIEMDGFGRRSATLLKSVASPAGQGLRRPFRFGTKRFVMKLLGQIPDPRLPFSLAFLSPFMAPEIVSALRNADVVITSAPPWPVHLAGLLAKWRFGCRLVLDYRDQIADNHIMPGCKFAKVVERSVDSYIARRADAIVAVSGPMAEYYGVSNSNTHTILNGYDPEIIESVRGELESGATSEHSVIFIRYLGRISVDRIPHSMLLGLSSAVSSSKVRPEVLRFEFYGESTQLEYYIRSNFPALQGMFRFFDQVPYREALELMMTADYLMFCETSSKDSLSAKGVLTTKLFEYIACNRPIIAEIAPDSEAGKMIVASSSAHFVSTTAADFENLFSEPRFLAPTPYLHNNNADALSRASQAANYLSLLDHLRLVSWNQ